MNATIDWNARIGQSAFNFLRHLTEDAPAPLLELMKGQLQKDWKEARQDQARLEQAVFAMLQLALGQDLKEIEQETVATAPPTPEPAPPAEPVAARFEQPKFYPQVTAEQLAIDESFLEEEMAAPRATHPPIHPQCVQINPLHCRPLQNSNAGWVGARNPYARFFKGQAKGE